MYSLGSSSGLLLRQLAAAGKSIFTHKDVAKLWKGTPQGLNNLLHRLVKRRWIARIERGKYIIIPFEAGPLSQYTEHEFVIASRLVSPYMIALWSALNHHGLTEQIPDRVYLLSKKSKRKNKGTVAGVSYLLIKVPKQRFFGASYTWIGQEKIWITDRPKTLLDAVVWPQHCGGFGEVAKAFQAAKDKIDLEKLSNYALKLGRGTAFKRLGILGEWLGWPRQFLSFCRHYMSAGTILLDPQGPDSGRQISRWRIKLNYPLLGFYDRRR